MSNKLETTIILENIELDYNEIRDNLRELWQIEVNGKLEKEELIFNVGNTFIKINENKDKNIKNIALNNIKNNLFWIDGEKEVKKGNKYLDVVVENGKDKLKLAKLMVKIVSSVLKLEGSIGVLNSFTVIAKQDYLEIADEMKDGIFPTLNLIYFGLYRTDNGIGGYTKGLSYFGKKEIEVLDTDVEVDELYNFLIDVADYVITQDVKLNDGESIGFTPNQKIPLVLSEGVASSEQSIKIGLTKENIL